MGGSLLGTDGYKFSMAEAGWPLRQETFYYAHRRGGMQVVPLDIPAFVRALLPAPSDADYAFLSAHAYEVGAGFKAAVRMPEALQVRAVPRGALVFPGEPLFSVTGPSGLVSWLEPQLLMLNYRLQVATLALTDREQLSRAVASVTCEAQRQAVLETLEQVAVRPPPVRVEADAYRERVLAVVRELVGVVQDPDRIFEVGLRAATSLEQHHLALEACREAGVRRTSNVLGAQQLGLIPVGTMGHEHVQRYGSDEAAFRAIRERRPYRSSYLLDTFDTLTSGIPAAYALIAEAPHLGDSIRYDSGNKRLQYLYATTLANDRGLRPVQILEDALDAEATRDFEALRVQVGWKPEEQFYGYGGHIVARPMGSPLTRDKVSAVYKLSQTGHRPVMKFGNEAGGGKQSLPGRPVVFRRRSGSGPVGVVGQEGEAPPDGYFLLTDSAPEAPSLVAAQEVAADGVALSPATRELVATLKRAAPRVNTRPL
jgi:nicotinic acid phosphoribosyltransferase